MLQDLLAKKLAQKRRQLSALQAAYRVSTRRVCEVIGLQRSTYYYQATHPRMRHCDTILTSWRQCG